MDKQIVDTFGAKVVRSTISISSEWIPGSGWSTWTWVFEG
jgi:hypothetical protein